MTFPTPIDDAWFVTFGDFGVAADNKSDTVAYERAVRGGLESRADVDARNTFSRQIQASRVLPHARALHGRARGRTSLETAFEIVCENRASR